jgi:hypothetical protein
MTDFTTYMDHTPVVRSGGANAAGYPMVTVFENTFYAAKRPLAAEDTVELLKVPAGSYVLGVFVHVLTPESTAATTLDVGDGAGDTTWATAAAVSAAGRIKGAGAAKFYATGDTLHLHVPATKALKDAVIRVVAVVAAIG